MNGVFSFGPMPLFLHGLFEVPQSGIAPHSHNSYELLFILQGHGLVSMEDRRYTFAPYDLIITRPAIHHYMEISGNESYERYICQIAPEHPLARIAQRISARREVIHCAENPLIVESFERLGKYQRECDEAIFSDLLNALLCEILYSVQMADKALLSAPERLSPVMERALEYINQNLFTINEVEEIASALFLAKNYFSRIFKSTMKISPMRYVTSKRLLAAQQLLRAGERPTSAHLRCGFSTYPAFYKRYVDYFGYAPSEERTRMRQADTAH
ncbi:MAG: helix-turn-helix domain-containing protein [Clostridia bacterium]|nr:helix-turn-helix domain-containing protein [Clostridia bacterium]